MDDNLEALLDKAVKSRANYEAIALYNTAGLTYEEKMDLNKVYLKAQCQYLADQLDYEKAFRESQQR